MQGLSAGTSAGALDNTVEENSATVSCPLPGLLDNSTSSLDSSGDAYVIQNCHERSRLKTDDSQIIGKVGELLAASYFLLVCKILRKIKKKKELKKLKIKALLVDKIAGVTRCELTGNVVEEGEGNSFELVVHDSNGVHLNENTLC